LIIIDTNIAIDLRDSEPHTARLIGELDGPPALGMISRIELEGGVYRDAAQASLRRRLLDRMLATVTVVMFTAKDIDTYGRIVSRLGYDRRLTLDRLIAAQAIARDATLITRNGKDFRKIHGLKLIEWETPEPGKDVAE
jgi:predicted nucleic acid-binding protein